MLHCSPVLSGILGCFLAFRGRLPLMMIIKWNLKTVDWNMWFGFTGPETGTSGGFS
jgi:hypothetical protein